MSNRRTFLPLRVVLTVPFVILILVTGILIGYLTFQNSQSAVNTLAQQLHTAVTARIQERLDGYLATPHLINQLNLDAASLDQVKLQNLDSLGRHFMIQIQRFDSVVSIAYANEQEEYAGATQKLRGFTQVFARASTDHVLTSYWSDPQGNRLEPTGTKVAEYDPRLRPWYRAAVQAGGPTWTPVYLWSYGYVGLDAVAPVYTKEGKLAGVLDTSLVLTGIGDFLQSLQIAQHGQAFIIDRSGLLVAASTIKEPYTREGEDLKRLAALDSADLVVRAAAQQLAQQYGAVTSITASQPFYFDLAGEPYFAQVTPYQDRYGLDWLIVVVVPESDFMAQIYTNNRNTALLVAASLLLSICIAALIARRVTRPISQLNQSARTLAHGDWTQKVVVERSDEVGELARAFNQMAEQLRASFASLHERIKELTALHHAARILQQGGMDTPALLHGLVALLPPAFQYPEVTAACVCLGDYTATTPGFADAFPLLRTDFTTIDGVHGSITVVYTAARPAEAEGPFLAEERQLIESLADMLRTASDRTQAEGRYRAISELVSDFAFAFRIDAGGTFHLEWITDAFTRLTGYTNDEVHTIEAWDQLIHPDDRVRVHAGRAKLAVGQTVAQEYRIRQKDGQEIWLRVYSRPIADAALGRISHIYGAARDITRLKQLEQQLFQSQKLDAMGQLAGGIAHDFNNLLTVILGSADMVLEDVGGDNPSYQDIAQIRAAAKRATALTRQLLAFSRKQVLIPSVVDLNAVVADIAPLLKRLIGAHITLGTNLAPELGRVLADPGQLEQVIVNLVVNARDAMPEGGALMLETANAVLDAPVPGNYVLLAVSDTGIGMDAATRERLFEPFFTTKEPGKGTGLGLATVYGIITQSGGHIWVDSELGQGTTFKAYLPHCDAPEQTIAEHLREVEAASAPAGRDAGP